MNGVMRLNRCSNGLVFMGNLTRKPVAVATNYKGVPIGSPLNQSKLGS